MSTMGFRYGADEKVSPVKEVKKTTFEASLEQAKRELAQEKDENKK